MSDDFHLYRKDRVQHWRAIAAYIRDHPEALEVPLANIARWLARGRLHPAPLLEWQHRITQAQASVEKFSQLLAYLEADNANSETLKSCSPFIGLEPTHRPASA